MRRLRTVRRFFPTPAWIAVVGSLVLVSMVSASARSAEPQRSARRYIPARGLVAYLEYEGLDAHAGAWEATSAHDMLVKTPAGAMFTDLFKQLIDGGLPQEFGGLVNGRDVMAVVDVFARNGLALACYDELDEGVLVLRNVGRPGNLERLDGARKAMEAGLALLFDGGFVSSHIRGRTVYQVPKAPDEPDQKMQPALSVAGGAPITAKPSFTRISAWREGDDWIVVIDQVGGAVAEKKPPAAPRPDLLTQVFDSIDGKQPDVTTHPGFISALAEGKDLKGFEANGLFFLEQEPGALGTFVMVDVLMEVVDMVMAVGSEIVNPDVRGTGQPKPGQGRKGTTGPPPKKEEHLALASTEPPAPGASKAGGGSEKGQPSAGNATRPSERVSPGSPPEPKQPAKPRTKAGSKDDDDAGDDGPDRPDKTAFTDELMREEAKQLGLDGVKRFVGRWGFQGKALLSDMRVEMPSPRRGMTTWFDQPAFLKDRLPMVPPGATDFILASFDPDGFYQKLKETAKGIDSEYTKVFPLFELEVKASIDLRLREDLLRHVGPTWAIVDVPDRVGPPGDHEGAGRKHTVLMAAVDDADAFEKVADSLASRIDRCLRVFEESERKKAPKNKGVEGLGMRRLPAPDRGYRVDLPPFIASSLLPERLAMNSSKKMGPLFLLIGKSSIVVAADLDRARSVLPAGEPTARWWKPSGELANAIDGLPDNLTFLSVSDPELCGLPAWIAGLPHTIRQMVISAAMSKDIADKTCWALLNLMGVPRPGQFWPRVDRARTPRAEDLRRCLFSSVLATAVDDRGYRVIQRQPFPFAGIASEIRFHHAIGIDWKAGSWPRWKYKIRMESPRLTWSE